MTSALHLGFLGADFPPSEEVACDLSTAALEARLGPRRRCQALQVSEAARHLFEGQRPPAVKGVQACRSLTCPYCGGTTMRRHQRAFLRRLSALDSGTSFAHVTFTCSDVALGELKLAMARIAGDLTAALACRSVKTVWLSEQVLGRFTAIHYTFTISEQSHPHWHILLAARGNAVRAAEALAEAYLGRLRRQGRPVAPETVLFTEAPTPADLIRYLTRPWSPHPNKDGSLDGLGLAAEALRGNEIAAQAYQELDQAFARKSLFRGTGCLGKSSS